MIPVWEANPAVDGYDASAGKIPNSFFQSQSAQLRRSLRPERGNLVAKYDTSSVNTRKPLRRQFGTFYDHKKGRNSYSPAGGRVDKASRARAALWRISGLGSWAAR